MSSALSEAGFGAAKSCEPKGAGAHGAFTTGFTAGATSCDAKDSSANESRGDEWCADDSCGDKP